MSASNLARFGSFSYIDNFTQSSKIGGTMSLSLDWVYEWLGILWGEFSAILINNGFILFSIIILPAFVLPVSPLLAFAGIWGN